MLLRTLAACEQGALSASAQSGNGPSWVALQALAYSVFETLESLLSVPSFVAVTQELLQHEVGSDALLRWKLFRKIQILENKVVQKLFVRVWVVLFEGTALNCSGSKTYWYFLKYSVIDMGVKRQPNDCIYFYILRPTGPHGQGEYKKHINKYEALTTFKNMFCCCPRLPCLLCCFCVPSIALIVWSGRLVPSNNESFDFYRGPGIKFYVFQYS